MLNYIRNIMKIEATPEKVFNAIQSDTYPELLIDFNKIISMSKSLEVEAVSKEDLVSLYMIDVNLENQV